MGEKTKASMTSALVWLCCRLKTSAYILYEHCLFKKKKTPFEPPQKPQLMFSNICIECRFVPTVHFSISSARTQFQKNSDAKPCRWCRDAQRQRCSSFATHRPFFSTLKKKIFLSDLRCGSKQVEVKSSLRRSIRSSTRGIIATINWM